jgi:hypothetical protein
VPASDFENGRETSQIGREAGTTYCADPLKSHARFHYQRT